VRTLRLEPGDEYEFHNYWNPDGNPVRIRVLRERRWTCRPARFNTVVIQPLIETSGLFSEGGEAEVFLSDDDVPDPGHARAKVSFGTLRLELEEYTPGRRLSNERFRPRAPG
jgi:hypothetical protein